MPPVTIPPFLGAMNAAGDDQEGGGERIPPGRVRITGVVLSEVRQSLAWDQVDLLRSQEEVKLVTRLGREERAGRVRLGLGSWHMAQMVSVERLLKVQEGHSYLEGSSSERGGGEEEEEEGARVVVVVLVVVVVVVRCCCAAFFAFFTSFFTFFPSFFPPKPFLLFFENPIPFPFPFPALEPPRGEGGPDSPESDADGEVTEAGTCLGTCLVAGVFLEDMTVRKRR